ncbi:MAG: hypothetical protein ACLT8H_05195 [Streptococcus parasanguinis]
MIRGVRLSFWSRKRVKYFLFPWPFLAPLSILGMAWGGRRILRKAFLPIQRGDPNGRGNCRERRLQYSASTEHQKDYVENVSALTKVFNNNLISSVQSTFEKEKQFNQNVSHELRTPLSVIVSESEFGSKYADNP